MSEEKIANICRVCLDANMKGCMSLFEKYKDQLLFNFVNSITNVNITRGDGLPSKICPACLLDLETAINFKQKCESSNVILLTSGQNRLIKTRVDLQMKDITVKKEELDLNLDYLEEDNFLDFSEYSNVNINKCEEPLLMKKELKSETGSRPQCHDCGDTFKSKCKLRVHWKKTHLPTSLICKICKRTFKSVKAYNNHMERKQKSCIVANKIYIEGQGRTRIFHCKDCNYKSHRIKDLQTHLVVHSGDKPFPCNMCSHSFSQQSSLDGHKESVHKQYKVEITCHICGKDIKGRRRAYEHLKTHNENQIQCDICKKMLKNKKILKIHMQRHTGVKTYTCDKCAKTFYAGSDLANHIRTIHDKGKYVYKCDICGYKSIRSEAVKKHKKKHTNDNISCTVCGMFFENIQKLTLHQKRHFDEKKYNCPLCDLKFFRKDSVKKHMKIKHRFMANPRPVAVKVKQESQIISSQNEVIEIEFLDDAI